MTSEERRESRYLRRKQRRADRKTEKYAQCDNFEWVFSYEHLYRSYQKCRKGVAWKASVQKYITQAPLNIYQTHQKLISGKFIPGPFCEFDISERGKTRHIRSIGIDERVVQKCLCDYALIPVLQRTFIHDNGASLCEKGYSFAIRRLSRHLQEHYRQYGTAGYILLFDFKKFFDYVSHKVVEAILREEFTDERIIRLAKSFIDVFGDRGLGLGSQVSQIFALASANRLDHYIKEVLCIRGYGRYMDDGYLLHPSKERLHECLTAIRNLCDELEITLNEKKTQIVKLSHGFTWLKVRFYLLPSGKIIKKMPRKAITRTRRRLKSLCGLLNQGKITGQDFYQSFQSSRAYAKQFDAHYMIISTTALYNSLVR